MAGQFPGGEPGLGAVEAGDGHVVRGPHQGLEAAGLLPGAGGGEPSGDGSDLGGLGGPRPAGVSVSKSITTRVAPRKAGSSITVSIVVPPG